MWNLLLVLQYNDGLLSGDTAGNRYRLLAGTTRSREDDLLAFLVFLEAVGLLWLWLVLADRGATVHGPAARVNPQSGSRVRQAVRWCTLLLVNGLLAAALWPGPKSGFVERVYRDSTGRAFKYVVFVPHGYRGDRPYPLIVYLHGAGARGIDGSKQVQEGLGPVIRRREASFDLIAVFPQAETGAWNADSPDGLRAMAILAEVEESYQIDPKRIYLTGSSMGGFGTWSLAARYPEKWAAIVPICGGGNPREADKIKGIPCWCFHGAADEVIPVQRSREMIQALQAVGGKARYDEYPGVGHNCWEKAYSTAGLFDWLLKQRLP